MMRTIQECVDCQHEGICRWTLEMERHHKEAKKIPDPKIESPISIKVSCDRYIVKLRKQDGMFSNQVRQC